MRGVPEVKTAQAACCPLYIAHSPREIVCKSFMIGAEKNIIRFDVKSNFETQLQSYCCGNYKFCEHYLSWKHFQWQDD